MTNDVERLVAEVDADLKKMAKADPRTIREIVESALKREFQTGKTAAVERRVEEKESRLTELKSQRNEREREIAEVKDELDRLKTTLQKVEENSGPTIDDAVESVSQIPDDSLTEDNPAVRNWASKVGITAAELIEEVQERQ